jgi:hypothetical protein
MAKTEVRYLLQPTHLHNNRKYTAGLNKLLYSYYMRTLNVFNVRGSAHHKNVLIYIKRDATLHSLFYLKTALHVSDSTITHHQERKQLHLQHLVFVTPLLLPAAIAADSSNGVTNTRCCRYSRLRF